MFLFLGQLLLQRHFFFLCSTNESAKGIANLLFSAGIQRFDDSWLPLLTFLSSRRAEMEMTVKNSPPLVHTHSVCASGSDIREPRGAVRVCVFEISSLSQPSHWADELVTCSSGTLRNERSFQRPRFHPLHLTIAEDVPHSQHELITARCWHEPLEPTRDEESEKTLAFIILKCGVSVSPDTMWWVEQDVFLNRYRQQLIN